MKACFMFLSAQFLTVSSQKINIKDICGKILEAGCPAPTNLVTGGKRVISSSAVSGSTSVLAGSSPFASFNRTRSRESCAEAAPWTVLLAENTAKSKGGKIEPFCMGSLISVQHVITAAHCIWHNKATFTGGCRPGCELAGDCNSGCVRRNPEDVYLYLGITDRFKPEEGFMRNVVKIILHPGYDKGADSEDQTLNGHDIAILTMSTSMEMFEIGKRSIPICLPESTHAYLTDEKEDLRVTGFGLFDQRHHRILQTASITIEDRRQCVAVWNKSNFSDICIKGDEGICPNQGDSGSGLVQQIYPRAGQFVLLALISFGDISCSRPSVATSIINHLDWIEKTISVNKKDKDGNNALHRAAKSGDLEKVEMLIEEYDADVNSQGQYGYTPLNWAAEKGHTKIVKLLLNTPGVDVNKKNTKGKTPLYNAAKYGHPEVVELLLDTPGVDVNAKDKGFLFAHAQLSSALWNRE